MLYVFITMNMLYLYLQSPPTLLLLLTYGLGWTTKLHVTSFIDTFDLFAHTPAFILFKWAMFILQDRTALVFSRFSLCPTFCNLTLLRDDLTFCNI